LQKEVLTFSNFFYVPYEVFYSCGMPGKKLVLLDDESDATQNNWLYEFMFEFKY
jgi:hypothetical protein